MHPYFHIFGLELPAYGIMALVGALIAGVFVVLHNRGGRFVPQGDLGLAMVYALAGVLIGAKALSLLTAIPYFIENFSTIFSSVAHFAAFLLNGWVFYGGLIGGFIGGYIFCRSYKVDFLAACAAVVPAIPLFHVFGRIGCFLAGCCYGVEHEMGIVFESSLSAPNGVPLLPVQLIEAAANVVIFAVVVLAQRGMKAKWQVLPLYVILYAVMRFTLEFWRGDAGRGVALLSTSQWISLALLAASVAFLILYFSRQKSAEKTRAVR